MEDQDFGEGVVGRVANAMYKSQVKRSREQAAEYVIDHDRLRRVFKVAFEESDRSAAILLFSLAEDLMLDGFKQYLNADVTGGWKAVFDGNGVLATAADRITMLHLLHWIQGSTCADLSIMKAIRNRFAHHADVGSFDDKKMQGWISTMSAREAIVLTFFDATDVTGWRKFTNRELYLMRATNTLMALVTDLAVGPVARFSRVSPGHVAGEWDDAPENLRGARRLAAEALLRCVPPQ